jgi:uncharacterized membrane protein YkvA (DUF1232 family)
MSFFTRLWTAGKIWQHVRRNPKTPAAATWLPILALVYLISPLDIIPDIVPFLGQLDDIGVIIALCTWAFNLIPKDVRRQAEKDVIDIEPKRG